MIRPPAQHRAERLDYVLADTYRIVALIYPQSIAAELNENQLQDGLHVSHRETGQLGDTLARVGSELVEEKSYADYAAGSAVKG